MSTEVFQSDENFNKFVENLEVNSKTRFVVSYNRTFNLTDEIRIVAVGKTGAGKSTVGNTLIGDGSFKVGEYSESETTQTTTKEGTWNGLKVRYADTPGLCDTKARDCEVKEEIGKCVEQLSPGPHIFFYVINADDTFTEEDFKSFNEFTRLYGDDVKEHTHIVFTHRKRRSNRKEHEKKYIEKAKTYLKTVLEKCTYRHSFIYQENGTDSKPDVDKFMELACRLKTANNNKHYDSGMYNQAVKQVKEQQEREADEKAAKEKKEKELEKKVQEFKEENERLKIERAEDKRKQLKLEHQRLQERDRDQRGRLICQLQLYRSTLSNYDIYTEKVRGEFNHVLIALTDKSKYDKIGQVGSSMGNIATSAFGFVGALTGPLSGGLMIAPTLIGIASSAYFKITSGTLQEKVCDISPDDDKHLSNISTEENKILNLLRNLEPERLKSDISNAIDGTKELKNRLQTLIENKESGIDWKNELIWFGCHAVKTAAIVKTVETVTNKTAKTVASRTMKTVTNKTVKITANRTMKTVTNKTVKTATTETTKMSTKAIGAVAFGAGLALDVKNICDNTLDCEEPEIIKTLKMRINECDETRKLIKKLIPEIDHVITELRDSIPGA